MSEPSVLQCPHIERGELTPLSTLEHRTDHGRSDGTYVFHRRMRLCAYCAGQIEAATAFLLAVGNIHGIRT